jgi:hypothetical protein
MDVGMPARSIDRELGSSINQLDRWRRRSRPRRRAHLNPADDPDKETSAVPTPAALRFFLFDLPFAACRRHANNCKPLTDGYSLGNL